MDNIAHNDHCLKTGVTEEKSGKHQYNLQILISLRKIIRAIDQYSRKLRTKHNITGPQLVCLIHVVNEQPHTITQISRSVSLSASTVVGIIDRLKEKGLVYRERSNKDRRQVRVIATEQGKTLVGQAPSPLQDKLARNLTDLTELEQSSIALALEKVVDMMEAKHIDAVPILESLIVENSSMENEF